VRKWPLWLRKVVVSVQRACHAKYAKDPTTDKTIRAWYKQFTGTRCLFKQKSSDGTLTAEDDVERVRASFLHSPNKSTGTAAIDVENNSVEGSS
jgi:hypothetical protein